MAKRFSSAAATAVQHGMSVGELFTNFIMMHYTGGQPATADAAATGVACTRFTQAAETGGAIVKETRAEWKFTLSSGASGTVNSVNIGLFNILPAAVTYATSLANTATLVVAAINAASNSMKLTARASGADVYIKAPKNSGVSMNSMVLTVGATTLVATVAGAGTPAASGGTNGIAAARCLSMAYPAVDGVTAKESAVWQGISGSGTGAGYVGFTVPSFTSGQQTIGWFRCYASLDDPELSGTPTIDSSKQYLRYDGLIGTDLTVTGGTTVAFGATQTQNSFTLGTPLEQG